MIATLALGVFVCTCSAVGLRLVWLGAKGGGSPAWSCGLGFLFIALIGYPLTVASGLGTATVGEMNIGLAAAGLLFVAAGLASFFAFTLTAFRLQTPWAWALTIVAIGALALSNFAHIGALAAADAAMHSRAASGGWNLWASLISLVCYGWMGAEGLLEWSRSRKRLALGLSDPVVSNRLLLWGLFGVSTTFLNLIMLGLALFTEEGSQGLVGQVALAGFGLVASAAAALAFFPPASYVAWVRASAATSSPTSS